jgi:hypothetical protein
MPGKYGSPEVDYFRFSPADQPLERGLGRIGAAGVSSFFQMSAPNIYILIEQGHFWLGFESPEQD